MQLLTIFWRACRLRCPACGRGPVFSGWVRMHERCPVCGTTYQRGPGFYLGSIYFNYGLTTVLLVATFFLLFFVDEIQPGVLPAMLQPTSPQLRWLLIAFALLFPLAFFRHARSFWLAFDEYFDPVPKDRPDR